MRCIRYYREKQKKLLTSLCKHNLNAWNMLTTAKCYTFKRLDDRKIITPNVRNKFEKRSQLKKLKCIKLQKLQKYKNIENALRPTLVKLKQ